MLFSQSKTVNVLQELLVQAPLLLHPLGVPLLFEIQFLQDIIKN